MRHEPLQVSESPPRPRVLVVDPAPERAAGTVVALEGAGFFTVHELTASRQELASTVALGWDVLVTWEAEAGEARAALRDCEGDVPVVVVRSRESDIAADVWNAVAKANARRERRRVAERLQQSEIRLRAAIEGGFDAFFVFDREEDERGEPRYRLAEVNKRGAELLCGSTDELVGKLFSEIAEHDLVEMFTERFARVFDSGMPLEEEYATSPDDLHQLWLYLQIVPLLTGVAVTARDITERKESESALRESEARFQNIVRHVPGVFFTVVPDEEHPGKMRFDFVSDGIEKLTGHEAEEFFGPERITLKSRLHPDDQKLIDEVDKRLCAGESLAIDIRIVHRDGAVNWAHLKAEPTTDESGAVCAGHGVMLDVTDRKRLEEQVLNAQKMEAVGRLAGGIAHDFNNVLLVIRGYSHVLMSLVGKGQEGWEEAKEIETAATRASDLIRHLLAFSRSQVMQTQVVNLNDAIEGMREVLEPLLGEDIVLRLAFDERLGAVRADPVLLEQTILNLVVNARDAMPRGGNLQISTRDVAVDASLPDAPQLPPGAYSRISLEDTGTGMDAETLARVFEPFFSTKTDAKGTGLGLPTAYGFVKQSGGDITITSAPDEGTAVRIYLPHASEVAVAPVRLAEPPRAPSAVETVLLVEDDDNARTLVGRILRESGYDVHEAGLPSEALSFSEQYDRQIHLLVSDVVMPQMSGPSVAKRVLEQRPETRVLFVSGYIDSADDVDIVSSGAAFLQKPFTPTELLSAVRRVLDEREAVPA